MQRTGVTPGETFEEPSQEQTHSTRDLDATEDLVPINHAGQEDKEEEHDPLLDLLPREEEMFPQPGTAQPVIDSGNDDNGKRQRIAWPKTADKKVWKDLDSDICSILDTALQGPVDRKMTTMTRLIYSISKERFGVVQKKESTQAPTMNRRQQQIMEIRKELRSIKKLYRKASDEEKEGLQQVRNTLREKLNTRRKAEQIRKKKKEKERQRKRFITNPYQFSKGLLDKERSGMLQSSLDEVQQHLHKVHSDSEKEVPLGDCSLLDPANPPETRMNMREPTFSEVQVVVRKARSSSAPGPNGIPYKVYKMCPNLLRILWSLLRVIWRKEKVPDCWRQAEGIFTPTEKDSKDISQFRTISLLNVEGKIFFAILAKRLTSYITDNN